MFDIGGLIFLLLIIAVFGGLIVLQIKLSKKEAVMPGLILPIASVIFALFIALSFTLYSGISTAGGTVETVSGSEIIIEEIQAEASDVSSDAGFSFIPVFLFNLLPCLFYLLIYFACHPFKKKNAELDKMSISDL